MILKIACKTKAVITITAWLAPVAEQLVAKNTIDQIWPNLHWLEPNFVNKLSLLFRCVCAPEKWTWTRYSIYVLANGAVYTATSVHFTLPPADRQDGSDWNLIYHATLHIFTLHYYLPVVWLIRTDGSYIFGFSELFMFSWQMHCFKFPSPERKIVYVHCSGLCVKLFTEYVNRSSGLEKHEWSELMYWCWKDEIIIWPVSISYKNTGLLYYWPYHLKNKLSFY